jgi:hypothetical protein
MAIILSVLRLVFPFYGHYIVCPSPRFSFLWPLYCLSFASFFLFMAIILSVLRLVFPYLWPLYCRYFTSFFLFKAIILSVLCLIFPFYGYYIVCPSPRFSFLWPLYCLSFASFFLFMAIILSVLRLVFPRTDNIMDLKRKNEVKYRQYNGHK